ncbi:sugar ABC transporter substrate-binding protein [Neobacillus sp. KR4-4]|uniref:sugar ABC transporter substrate-binding protein n=1 Tax=Neobacillus sp. KR4-4 TaxID=3344872 RepID=UPI0035CA5F4D
MKNRLMITAITLLTAMLLLAGCGGQESSKVASNENGNKTEKDSGKPKVAVVLKGLDQEYFKLAEKGAKQAFEDLGVDGTFLAATTQTETEKLINILEDLTNEEPDALVVMPSTEAAIPVLQRYKEKDIPVILIDTDLKWDGKTAYIGTDNYTAGQEAGKFLAEKLSKGDKIAILEGVLGTDVNEQRVKGVEDVMKEKGIKITASQAADFDRVKAVTVMENILTANPDIKGIFTANDEMAIGALKAVKARNLNIPIIGIDGTSDVLKSISKGDVTASVAQEPYDMAYKGVENALKAIKGETVEKNIDSSIEVITKENAGEKLEKVKSILDK